MSETKCQGHTVLTETEKLSSDSGAEEEITGDGTSRLSTTLLAPDFN